MKIYMISNMYPSPIGISYGIFVKKFESTIKKKFVVKRIVLTKKKSFLGKLFGYLSLGCKIVQLYFKVKPNDLVYVHFPTYMSVFLQPFLWLKIPIVLNFHGSDIVFNSKLKKLLFPFLNKLVLGSIKIVVPSETYKNRVIKLFNIDYNNVFIYPSGGVDSNVFYEKIKKDSIFRIGFVSNFIYQKGWANFLESIEMLKDKLPEQNFEAVMVGDGPDKNQIQNIITQKNLPVKIVSGVPQKILADIYTSFSVFVFPTHRESLGLVGLEAMMCGVPVIASDVEGPSEYMRDGINGFLFEKDNSLELTQNLLNYISLSEKELIDLKLNCVNTSLKFEKKKVNGDLLEMLRKIFFI